MYITQHELELFTDLFMLLLCCGKLTADGFLCERVIQRQRDSWHFWIALLMPTLQRLLVEISIFDLYVVWCSNKNYLSIYQELIQMYVLLKGGCNAFMLPLIRHRQQRFNRPKRVAGSLCWIGSNPFGGGSGEADIPQRQGLLWNSQLRRVYYRGFRPIGAQSPPLPLDDVFLVRCAVHGLLLSALSSVQGVEVSRQRVPNCTHASLSIFS